MKMISIKNKLFRFLWASILILIVFCQNSYAQREANIWYFGDSAGIDFNSGHPVALTDGNFSTWEGIATISDSLGNLLFYTEGSILWNKNHKIALNGTSLRGHNSSTECAIFVPHPGNDSIYYMFTVDWEANDNGLCYSVINKRLDKGLGGITYQKNIQLIQKTPEKVTAVRNFNNKDIWLISHSWNSDSFYIYKVTKTGFDPIPQIQEIGSSHRPKENRNLNSLGYMRASPDGTKLALAIMHDQKFELFDFDNQTGTLSNPITINIADDYPYCPEFSPDCSKLYLSAGIHIYQLDLAAGSAANIINSLTLVATAPDPSRPYGAIQLATDGRIYVAHDNSYYIDIIDKPNLKGASCNYLHDGFYLNGKKSRLGLPNFIQSYFYPPSFSFTSACEKNTIHFTATPPPPIDSLVWNFGDPLSGNLNTSRLTNPTHVFSKSGFYQISLTYYKFGIEKKSIKSLTVNPLPPVNLGKDTFVCGNQSIKLVSNLKNVSFLWNDNSIVAERMVNLPGKYTLKATDINTFCENSDTIQLVQYTNPIFDLGNNQSICPHDSILLKPNKVFEKYLWSNSSTNQAIMVKNSGKFKLTVKDLNTCSATDSIEITHFSLPTISINKDTILCEHTEMKLRTNHSKGNLLWNNTLTTDSILISQIGKYWVTISDSNLCRNSDTISIYSLSKPEITNLHDTLMCENEQLNIELITQADKIQWNTGELGHKIRINQPGNYSVNATNFCGTTTKKFQFQWKYCGDVFIPNAFTPNNDGVNDVFFIKGIENEIWELKIVNRWGKIIYLSGQYDNTWDGKKHPDGVYFYIFSNFEKNIIYKGNVHIYR